MGLKPIEVKALLYKDFNLMLGGYHKRLEQERNHIRHIVWAVMSYSGMGLESPIQPQDVWPLDMDKEDEKKMITSLKMAMELLNEFMADD